MLRQQNMNIFLISLAVSDILMAIMVVPGYTAFCAGCKYLSSDTCWILAQTKDIVFSSSFFSLLAITYDRYLAVLRPLLYSSKMTRAKVTCMVISIWVIPAIVATARNIWWQTQEEEKAKAINQVYNVILVFLLVVLPAIIMTLVNTMIIRAIRTQRRKTIPVRDLSSLTSQEFSCEETRAESVRKRKGTSACAAVVLVFVLSWVPRSIYNFAFVFGGAALVTPLLVKLSMFFLLLQSCVNPFIYSFYRTDFRQAARRLFKFRG
ncbi:adenosine receptor A2a-like [Stylophora pistillata]|uniref:adenosine receptor A2a-like n=1 Tax=Stylophora pistillata TaxID=50429 RepID=UPI000C049F79|nr:adenosine receptor A2a-like [Stylophora pistillata]XP_022790807.1 adenosine receptor A2a-like [Stylophora pistillata]XP_022790808.1 adenosine receptor A2a-like [Stylophora pistillata]